MQGGDNANSENKLPKKKSHKKKRKFGQFLAFLSLGVLAIAFGLVEAIAGNLSVAVLSWVVGAGLVIAGLWS
jgi:uncharacterized membrane protein HdeD (DUF308 family)